MPRPVTKSTFRSWIRRYRVPIGLCGAFAVAYLAFSFVGAPHVVDNYPDSHTYLPISFLGHAQRLWTVPLFYFFGGNAAGRVALQTIFGVICWITLAVQIGRVIETSAIRLVAQVVVLLIGLTAPVLQWNRIVLSESITISLTVLVFARLVGVRPTNGQPIPCRAFGGDAAVDLHPPGADLRRRGARRAHGNPCLASTRCTPGGARRDRWNRNYWDLGSGDCAPDVEDAHRGAGRWHRAVPRDRRSWGDVISSRPRPAEFPAPRTAAVQVRWSARECDAVRRSLCGISTRR